MKKAIIFDLDGTLLNTDTLIQESFKHVFKKYMPEHTLRQDELLSFLGPSLKDTFSRYFDQTMVEELINYYREFNHSHHEDYVTIYPYVKETLQKLKELGYPLGIVTTKVKDAVYIGLDLFDLNDCFDVIIGHEDVINSKPDPEGIFKALKALNACEGYYIGDNVTDIQAGKNARLKTIGVKWSPKGYDLMEKENPDCMVDSYQGILEYILKEEKQC